MKIHEYQAKEVLRKFGVRTLRGVPCFTVDEAVAAGTTLGGKVWVQKYDYIFIIFFGPIYFYNSELCKIFRQKLFNYLF